MPIPLYSQQIGAPKPPRLRKQVSAEAAKAGAVGQFAGQVQQVGTAFAGRLFDLAAQNELNEALVGARDQWQKFWADIQKDPEYTSYGDKFKTFYDGLNEDLSAKMRLPKSKLGLRQNLDEFRLKWEDTIERYSDDRAIDHAGAVRKQTINQLVRDQDADGVMSEIQKSREAMEFYEQDLLKIQETAIPQIVRDRTMAYARALGDVGVSWLLSKEAGEKFAYRVGDSLYNLDPDTRKSMASALNAELSLLNQQAGDAEAARIEKQSNELWKAIGIRREITDPYEPFDEEKYPDIPYSTRVHYSDMILEQAAKAEDEQRQKELDQRTAAAQEELDIAEITLEQMFLDLGKYEIAPDEVEKAIEAFGKQFPEEDKRFNFYKEDVTAGELTELRRYVADNRGPAETALTVPRVGNDMYGKWIKKIDDKIDTLSKEKPNYRVEAAKHGIVKLYNEETKDLAADDELEAAAQSEREKYEAEGAFGQWVEDFKTKNGRDPMPDEIDAAFMNFTKPLMSDKARKQLIRGVERGLRGGTPWQVRAMSPEEVMKQWAEEGRLDRYGRLVGIPTEEQFRTLGIQSFEDLDLGWLRNEGVEVLPPLDDPQLYYIEGPNGEIGVYDERTREIRDPYTKELISEL